MSGERTWPDLAGRLVAGSDGARHHVLPVRVYFEDTDFSGSITRAMCAGASAADPTICA